MKAIDVNEILDQEPDRWLKIDSDAGTVIVKNIPGVLPCFCRSHPITMTAPLNRRSESGEISRTLFVSLTGGSSDSMWSVIKAEDITATRAFSFDECCPMIYSFKNIVCCLRHPFGVASFLKSENDNWFEILSLASSQLKKFLVYDNFNSKWLSNTFTPVTWCKREDYDRSSILSYSLCALQRRLPLYVQRENPSECIIDQVTLEPSVSNIDLDSLCIDDELDDIFLDPEEKTLVYKECKWIFDKFGYRY